MFASHGALGKRRCAALDDFDELERGRFLGANSESSQPSCRETEPDVQLIKQVEQVTTSALEGLAWRFAGIPSMGVADAAEILVFLIWQLLHWLLFGCKNSQKGPDDLLAKGQSDNAAGPNRRFHEPGHMGCRAVALQNSVRLIHNRGNLACCPDFKMSHYWLTSTDAVSYDSDVSQMIYR
jgi:hypothetical protein